MYRLFLISSLLVSFVKLQPTSTTPPSTTTNPTSSTSSTSKPGESENCIVLCLTAMNVLIFGVVVVLVLCICAVICQQQPREIFYLVDRIPDQNPALRPAAVNLDPKIHSGKSPIGKEPMVSEPMTPKQRQILDSSTDTTGTVKKSVQIEISPQDNVTIGHSRLYSTQDSIEDDPIPIAPLQPIALPLKDQKPQTPFVRPHSASSPVGAVANAVSVPAASQIPIVISEPKHRAGSTPAAGTTMPV